MLRKKGWLAVPVALLIWANWEAPEMHHFVRPAATAVWQLAPLGSPEAVHTLETRLAAEPGVSACAVSERTGCVALVYRPEEASPEALYQAVSRNGGRVVTPPPAPAVAPAIRQCPIPAGYVLWLDQVRFALNLRRFFVAA
jgi:hypothetical protein